MSAAFNSETKRGFQAGKEDRTTETEANGNPQEAFAKATFSKSFAKSALNGRGGFGSCTGRDLPWSRTSESARPASPARGASPGRTRRETAQTARGQSPARAQSPSSVFASRADRFGPKKDATPGPGAYTDRAAPHSVKRSSSFGASTSRRFENHKKDGPDPGQYGPLRSAFAPPTRGPSASFGAKSRRELFDKSDEGPDPSSYVYNGDTLGWAAQKQKYLAVPSAAFADTSGRFEKVSNRGPDPGLYYNEKSASNIAAVRARGTLGKSAARGAGGFGSSSAREQRVFDKVKDEEVPGPGSYEQRAPLSPLNGSSRGGSAFASKSARCNTRMTDAPGVGAYEGSAVPGIADSKKSHNKSSSSFGSKQATLWEARSKAQQEGPAPGAYDQAHSTMEQKVTQRSSMSASFASNALRDPSFLGLPTTAR